MNKSTGPLRPIPEETSIRSDDDDDRYQKAIKCKVKIYKIDATNMQRCPYIHEMKERLLGEQIPMEPIQTKKIPTPPPLIMDQHYQQPVATIVKLNPDGYGSHTSPTHHRADRTPLMPKEPEDDFRYVETSVYPKNAKTSLFIIMSFVYAKLLIVVCIAYVISDVVTHNIPLYYYEGFFTYLYGMSILFLLYVFCFLLQESACCAGSEKAEAPQKVKKPPKEKAKEKEKEKKKEEEKKKKEEEKKKKEEEKKKKEEEKKKKLEKEKDKGKPGGGGGKDKKQEKEQQAAGAPAAPAPPPSSGAVAVPPPVVPPPAPTNNASSTDVEACTAAVVKCKRKRKTTQNDHSHGSFFLRIGAIAFGLGTMIYNGLEFGSFFEIPFTSPCYMILRGVNPVLQMVFTFMQMYFIFMNSRLNIHRFKVIARFGLMHVVATNICVWIRTLVLEYLKEITNYHKKMLNATETNASIFAESIRLHNIRNANAVLGSHLAVPDVITTTAAAITTAPTVTTTLRNFFRTTARTASSTLSGLATTLPTTTSTRRVFTTPRTAVPTTMWRLFHTTPNTPPTTPSTTTTTRAWRYLTTTLASTTTTTTTAASHRSFFDFRNFNNFDTNNVVNVAEESNNVIINGSETEFIDDIIPQAFRSWSNYWMSNASTNATNLTTAVPLSCGRVNIMGTIVADSAPYLFPFIIEYSLIGAAVIYVMWKHIGKNPRYVTQEDLEHRLEVMLSRRAVAMAQAQQQGRVDCVGASKGLFFGLLLLVGSLICLILFFVLIHHPNFGLLAIYLADVSHCVLMVLSIIAIIIGFIRVQSLKFKTEEQSDLNDILLRVSAFGLFIYAVFSVIAGHLEAFTKEPNLLVMVTGCLAVVQVILQLLFIADVSRRRVHLPEHDRSKPGRQVVTFLLICNVTMWIIYTFEMQKVEANPVQLDFYGFLAWAIVQRVTLPLCIFHRFHSAVTLAEIWKTSYKARLE